MVTQANNSKLPVDTPKLVSLVTHSLYTSCCSFAMCTCNKTTDVWFNVYSGEAVASPPLSPSLSLSLSLAFSNCRRSGRGRKGVSRQLILRKWTQDRLVHTSTFTCTRCTLGVLKPVCHLPLTQETHTHTHSLTHTRLALAVVLRKGEKRLIPWVMTHTIVEASSSGGLVSPFYSPLLPVTCWAGTTRAPGTVDFLPQCLPSLRLFSQSLRLRPPLTDASSIAPLLLSLFASLSLLSTHPSTPVTSVSSHLLLLLAPVTRTPPAGDNDSA